MALLSLILTLFLPFSPAHADILFIGLNPAAGEIKAAQEAATERHENLIIIPQLQEGVVRHLQEMTREEADLIRKSQKGLPDAELMKTSQRLLAIKTERETLFHTQGLTPSGLTSAIADLEKRGVQVTSLILSGHDGNGRYWGMFAEDLTADDFKAAFSAAPRLSQTIRSLSLLGCYTAKAGALDTYWKKAFPQVKAFVGYGKKGPLASTPAGQKFLKDFLLKDARFPEAKTKEEMLKLFQGLADVRNLAAVIATDQYLVSNSGVQDLGKMYDSCKNLNPDSPLRRQYECHYQALAGCEEAPKDTKSGIIRQFYEELQDLVHCPGMLTAGGDHSLPEPQVVLSMIFFNTVIENFKRLSPEPLDKLDDRLKRMGLEPIHLKTFKQSRGELFRLLRKTHTAVEAWGEGLTPSADNEKSYALKTETLLRLEEIDQILLQLKPACVPSAWVDPYVAPQSKCLSTEENLKNKAAPIAQTWTRGGSR